MTRFVELLEPPGYATRHSLLDSGPARKLADEIRRTESSRRATTIGSKRRLIELGRNRDFKDARKGSGKNYRTGVLREDVWQAREELAERARRFRARCQCRSGRAAAPGVARLRRPRTKRAKAKAGALDFLDLLLKARDLIRDDPEVRAKLSAAIQADLRRRVSGHRSAAGRNPAAAGGRRSCCDGLAPARPVPGKLFIVGDPKQSIYRFRRADVGVYRSVYEMLKAAGAKRVTLRTSFRARPNIQRVINAAFAPVMTGDPDALQADYVPLEPFRADPAEQPSVVVLPVPEPYGTGASRTSRSKNRCPMPSARSSTGSSARAAGRSPSGRQR